MTDEQRERLIDAWRVIVELEPDHFRQHAAFDRMRELITDRSPTQLARMERERGLRAS